MKSILATTVVLIFLMACAKRQEENTTWEVYRGDGGSNAYSKLKEINTQNVKQLKTAWVFRTGDQSGNSTLECNPIIVHDILYGISPMLKTFALDAKTGK